ncbi:hypothetical protein [Pollutibacter soli]|uniref:hypothetical protein n=1 Tax=Pollutibacter soli TaxID=3034157 RepID=UPI003013BBF5
MHTNFKLKRRSRFCNRKTLNFCFVAFLTVVFSLQQFSALAHTFHSGNQARAKGEKIQISHAGAGTQIAADFPYEEDSREKEAELNEEEVSKLKIGKHLHHFIEKYFTGEPSDNSFLQSQFLQINSSIQNRSSVPFFILHRSWKSFLS